MTDRLIKSWKDAINKVKTSVGHNWGWEEETDGWIRQPRRPAPRIEGMNIISLALTVVVVIVTIGIGSVVVSNMTQSIPETASWDNVNKTQPLPDVSTPFDIWPLLLLIPFLLVVGILLNFVVSGR